MATPSFKDSRHTVEKGDAQAAPRKDGGDPRHQTSELRPEHWEVASSCFALSRAAPATLCDAQRWPEIPGSATAQRSTRCL